jgi:protein-disulfide isomerase
MKKEDVEKLAKELNVDITGMKFFEAKSAVLNAQKDQSPTSSSGANTAIVRRGGGFEVRRYTLDMHGENFESMANEFAGQDANYTVEVTNVETHNVTCPHCNETFTQTK